MNFDYENIIQFQLELKISNARTLSKVEQILFRYFETEVNI